MRIVKFRKELEEYRTLSHQKGDRIGLVPTMGALHDGHHSLLKKCTSENDVSICSIFVNPAQFNDKNDLKNYPRKLENDLKIAENAEFDVAFIPDENEMYPVPDRRIFEFGQLGEVMEGKYRPGHFNGVAQIVTKLFEAAGPDNAYFGEKDFQQLTIIKFLVQTLNLPVHIVACSTVRESDGLAMSSRNLLLTPDERRNAPLIFQTLSEAVDMKKSNSISRVIGWVIERINSCPYLKVEYFDIVNDINLQPVIDWNEKSKKVGCIAVKTSTVRLIDNIRFD
jgi:pantoate--beta-alanine ligase